jgi:hypothetical protein
LILPRPALHRFLKNLREEQCYKSAESRWAKELNRRKEKLTFFWFLTRQLKRFVVWEPVDDPPGLLRKGIRVCAAAPLHANKKDCALKITAAGFLYFYNPFRYAFYHATTYSFRPNARMPGCAFLLFWTERL